MYGAIIGDIAGSIYERHNVKSKDFPWLLEGSRFTDDSAMTVAVAKALLRSRETEVPFKQVLIEEMQSMGQKYPNAGYGGMFRRWIWAENPQPYGSFGNGSAMRVSPCGLIAVTMEEALSLAGASAEVTHDHPEGIKGAQAIAACVFLAKCGRGKEEIRAYVTEHFYSLDQTLDEVRPGYHFDVTCQGSVPQAIQAFLESENFEDAIRNAISIGGDSDTIAAMAGSIAWSFYRFQMSSPDKLSQAKAGRIWTESCDRLAAQIDPFLPAEFIDIIEEFDIARMHRSGTYDRTGFCSPIPI